MSIVTGRFAGKVATVTGGASGIGLAITRRLIAEGANVAAGDVNAAGLDDLTANSAIVFGVRTDVTKEADIEQLMARTTERFASVHTAFYRSNTN